MRARFLWSLGRAIASAVASAFALLAATVSAAVVWHSLGTTSVKATPAGAAAQQDEIRLMSARGPFTTIRLEVDGGSITLDRLVVTFVHGSTQNVDMSHKTFESGALTPEIQLAGNDHVIRKVAFWYTAPKFATVRLYAH